MSYERENSHCTCYLTIAKTTSTDLRAGLVVDAAIVFHHEAEQAVGGVCKQCRMKMMIDQFSSG